MIFSFLLENVDPRNPDVMSLFSVIPSNGKLSPLDRPTQVCLIMRNIVAIWYFYFREQ